MWMYLVAGICLLIAIVFIVKFFLDNKKSKTNENKPTTEIPEITVEEGKSQAFNNKSKKDLIIAFIFMALCEVCILIGNRI